MDKQEQRKASLLSYICKNAEEQAKYENLIDDMVFIETQLENLKKLPFIKVNPKDASQQKATPAAKQYKELLAQYTVIVRVLSKINIETGEEDSPLRAWVNSMIKEE